MSTPIKPGDFIGAAVTLAARVSAAAAGGEVLLTAHTRRWRRISTRPWRTAATSSTGSLTLRSAGAHGPRRSRRPAERRLAIDPICHMVVDPRHAAGRLVHQDGAHFFCSLTCVGRVEATAYFTVCEELTDVARTRTPPAPGLTVERRNGHVDVEVGDDGVGGADMDSGSGLQGLRGRVAAVHGTLELVSPPGTGTVLRARLPTR